MLIIIYSIKEEICIYCSKPANEDEKHAVNNIALHAAGSRTILSDYVKSLAKHLEKGPLNWAT